jgi:hypothetical protein
MDGMSGQWVSMPVTNTRKEYKQITVASSLPPTTTATMSRPDRLPSPRNKVQHRLSSPHRIWRCTASHWMRHCAMMLIIHAPARTAPHDSTQRARCQRHAWHERTCPFVHRRSRCVVPPHRRRVQQEGLRARQLHQHRLPLRVVRHRTPGQPLQLGHLSHHHRPQLHEGAGGAAGGLLHHVGHAACSATSTRKGQRGRWHVTRVKATGIQAVIRQQDGNQTRGLCWRGPPRHTASSSPRVVPTPTMAMFDYPAPSSSTIKCQLLLAEHNPTHTLQHSTNSSEDVAGCRFAQRGHHH